MINVGDWVRIDVWDGGEASGMVVRVVGHNAKRIVYNWNGFTTLTASVGDVTSLPNYGGGGQ